MRDISLKARFEEKVDRSGGLGVCWPWKAAKNTLGYGVIGEGHPSKKTLMAHRVAWILEHGPIPEGMQVLHHCDNPACCNAVNTDQRLFLGTQHDNMIDRSAKGRTKTPAGYTSEGYHHWHRELHSI